VCCFSPQAVILAALAAMGCTGVFPPADLARRFMRYCDAVLTPALHNVLETTCKEDSEFSLKGLVKGFNAYKEVRWGAAAALHGAWGREEWGGDAGL
jgi:hypothetical protein